MSLHGAQQFHYGEAIAAFITKVYPLDPRDRRFYVDAIPNDFRGMAKKAPLFCQPGIKRNLRIGQAVLIVYVNGNAQLPLVVAHGPNNENVPAYADPLPTAVVNPDDLVVHHDETQAFARFRAVNSSASGASVDGGPCLFEITFRSGATLQIEEYNPPGYPLPPPTPPATNPTPPKPPRAKLTLDMPSGESLVIDEPAQGKATLTLRFAEGDELTRDQNGNWTLDTTAPNANVTINAKQVTLEGTSKVLIGSPDVELGADGGQELAFKSDVQAMKTYLDSHIHTGVTAGGGTSGVPSQPSPAPVGTVNTKAF